MSHGAPISPTPHQPEGAQGPIFIHAPCVRAERGHIPRSKTPAENEGKAGVGLLASEGVKDAVENPQEEVAREVSGQDW